MPECERDEVGNVVNHLSEDPREFYERCHRAALTIHNRKAFPVFIGGDHSISAPLIRACKETHKHLTLIHFDAHTDLGEWDSSATHHHGNVMSRVLHENPELKIHQIGIRGFAGAPSLNSRCHVVCQREIDVDLNGVLSKSIPRDRTCYISLDVDVLDPSFAPGTGTPVPMGMTPSTLFRLLEAIARQNRIVGIDIVELCPGLDRNDMTTSLIFHLLMCLLGWAHESR
ncbi:MAG: arginase family protein [Parcubacteria group bacterium]|nr:arginase family protein [Parcubacteria group bacterium]